MLGASPPPVRGVPSRSPSIDFSLVVKAIETVRNALPYIVVGPPLIRYGPAGEVHVDVPLMYHDFALDRVHYDPYLKCPSPKGRPVRAWSVRVDPNEARSAIEAALKEVVVIEAGEYREPEYAWAIPLAWRNLIIAHIKVSYDARELIPDYGLTEEVRRFVV